MKYAIFFVLAFLLLTLTYALLAATMVGPIKEVTLVGSVLFWSALTLFVAPLICVRFRISTVVAVNWILGGGLVVLTVVPFSAAFLYGRYDESRREQKSICVERVKTQCRPFSQRQTTTISESDFGGLQDVSRARQNAKSCGPSWLARTSFWLR